MLYEKLLQDGLMFWATIDPIGTLAIFAALTMSMARCQQRHTAFKAILYSTIILVGSVFLGQMILKSMGIYLVSLQLAGGVILFLFGLKMIFGELDEYGQQPEAGHDMAVFPLAVPSIASPGAMMAVILATDNNLYGIGTQIATVFVLLLVLGVTFLFMLIANTIMRFIGHNGANILIRVMGLILAALSTQLILEAGQSLLV